MDRARPTRSAAELAEDELEDAAVAEVLHLVRGVDPHPGAELLLGEQAAVCGRQGRGLVPKGYQIDQFLGHVKHCSIGADPPKQASRRPVPVDGEVHQEGGTVRAVATIMVGVEQCGIWLGIQVRG